MSIESIAAISASSEMATASVSPMTRPTVSGASFEDWLVAQLDGVNRQIGTAENSLVQLAAGQGNLHDVMIQLEQARTAFQLTLQVRNKLLESYQELMRMQL